MKLLYCPTCRVYTRRGKFDINTRHPGTLIMVDGTLKIRLGDRALPKEILPSAAQAAYCHECGSIIDVVDVDVCPHETDERYWIIKENDPPRPPVRVCELCLERVPGQWVIVWP